MDTIKVLIFDSNRVFARKIGELLDEVVNKKLCIDYAYNIPVLKNRVTKNKYDIIFADMETAYDREDDIKNILDEVQTPVVMWSMFNKATSDNVITKLSAITDIKQALYDKMSCLICK